MASAANGARQIKDRALSARSIRVLVSPTPITFAERRSVLQVLEQYGAVETFRLLPGQYGNFISVTQEATTAQRLIASSPLSYNLIEPRAHTDDIHVADLAMEPLASSHPSISRGRETKEKQEPGHEEAGQERTEFTLSIFPAPDFRHRFSMAGSPLHGAWPSAWERDRSFMTTTLRQSLPNTMVGKGLAHWLVEFGTAYRMERKNKRLQVRGLIPSFMKKNARGE